MSCEDELKDEMSSLKRELKKRDRRIRRLEEQIIEVRWDNPGTRYAIFRYERTRMLVIMIVTYIALIIINYNQSAILALAGIESEGINIGPVIGLSFTLLMLGGSLYLYYYKYNVSEGFSDH